ncbi:MFS polyamine transporter [Mycena chlorophos]|uniref:MFS polyamine transporter n=1 Tax=Mycena chlorophos TaxID=658473 RepID=A0A8H6W9Q1_MYCCL|nr:MFS polyamine transporter [Mycena chlorophos]
MPSEPLEAEFAHPPALSGLQEDELRELELEGPIRVPEHVGDADAETGTVVDGDGEKPPSTGTVTSLRDLERAFTKEGVKVVSFEPGAGEDPREWGRGKKWYITMTTAFLCLAVALGSSMITGDLQTPVTELHTTPEIVNLTVSCFVIGFGIGPLVFAPLSEVVGRKPIYAISMLFYFIFTLPGALAKNAATLVIGRQLAGLAASAPMCNVGGSVADIWSVEERGLPMAFFSATIFMGPCLGPLVGGWIGQYAGWRWIYWVLFIFCGFCFALTLFIPETLAPVLLKRKAAALRKSTGDDSYQCLAELERVPFSQTLRTALLRPIVMLLSEPVVLFMTFYLSFVYSLLYLLFFAFPIAFEEIRGYTPGITGVTFVSIILGIMIAMLLMPFQERLYAKVTKNGSFPEARLFPMMLGSITLPFGLFIFAFTGAYAHVSFMGPCVAGALFGFSMILLYVSANSYIVDSYSAYAASAIAAKTLLRSLVGAAVPLYVEQMFHAMGFQWAGLLLALVAVGIMPIPFVFWVFGERIRMRSGKAEKRRRVRAEDVLKDLN